MTRPPDPGVLAHFIARQVARHPETPPEIDLAERIAEIEMQTQIAGASFIKVHVIDPEWDLATTGWLDVKEGFVGQIEVEYPEGSKWFWRLCAMEISNDISQPNLILTFEDRIIAYMREYTVPRIAPPGTKTRAEFVRDLVREVGKHGEPKIDFRCPALHTVQPLEANKEEKTEKLETAAGKAAGEAKANKSPGVTAGSGAAINGVKLSSAQVHEANTLMDVARELNAPALAAEAMMFAAIAESGISASANNGKYWGVLSAAIGVIPQSDTKEMAKCFLLGGKGFQSGGAIALAKSVADPIEIAVRVEAPSIWPANAYASETGYAGFLPAAREIIAQGGGISATGGGVETKSDVGQLSRGTPDNPDEDSWETVTRLAGQVNWYAFTNGSSLFYLNGPQMAKQRPALHVEAPQNRITDANGAVEIGAIQAGLHGMWDDTTLSFRKAHKVKGRAQRRSRISKPSSPSEIRMNLVCDVTDYRAGDVFEFRKSGPLNGRWIVSDATRNCLKDIHTQFTLIPPLEPLPEPRATTGGEAIVAASAQPQGVPSGFPAREAGQYRSPAPQGPTGTSTFQGITVATWTLPMLEYAQKHGWKGQITSGYRPGPDPHTATGGSEHAGTQYPHGAIDFGGYTPNPNPVREAFFVACAGFTGLPLIPAQFAGDGGHASGTGH